ncbi:kinase-like domain-containing protein [Podospora appendiculata]|uniref:Kinase-like domain-containing protein n=1 Tax=Podospora appendiculata TaxID=314037 RepID=A0AAE0XJA9_9PEZI|nr:kinase-like domain-containing protein [Podospora appendiculata]
MAIRLAGISVVVVHLVEGVGQAQKLLDHIRHQPDRNLRSLVSLPEDAQIALVSPAEQEVVVLASVDRSYKLDDVLVPASHVDVCLDLSLPFMFKGSEFAFLCWCRLNLFDLLDGDIGPATIDLSGQRVTAPEDAASIEPRHSDTTDVSDGDFTEANSPSFVSSESESESEGSFESSDEYDNYGERWTGGNLQNEIINERKTKIEEPDSQLMTTPEGWLCDKKPTASDVTDFGQRMHPYRRVRSKKASGFPADLLADMITVDCVRNELSKHLEDTHDDKAIARYAEKIRHNDDEGPGGEGKNGTFLQDFCHSGLDREAKGHIAFTFDGRRETRGSKEKIGGFGRVFEADIHTDHHDFHEDELSFAIKCLHSQDRVAFKSEVDTLKKFSNGSHPHLISLLATYEQHGSFYLIFPRANIDLQGYWEHINPAPRMDHDTVLWVAQQCKGIANGVLKIHEYRSSNSRPEPESPRKVFGHHGDIKPEKVLWFSDSKPPEDLSEAGSRACGGVLKLSGFGLAELNTHRTASMLRNNNNALSCAYMYRAPECDLPGVDRKGRQYGI